MSSRQLAVGSNRESWRKRLAFLAAGLAAGLGVAGARAGREPVTERATRVAVRAPVFARLAPIEPVRLQDAAGIVGYVDLGAVEAVEVAGLPAVEALGAAADRLAVDAEAAYKRLEGAGRVDPMAPVIAPIGASLAAVVAVAPGYAPLGGVGAVAADPFLAPLDIWRDGPLGLLRAEALAAADQADWNRFDALTKRFWELYAVAEARRTALGDGRQERSGGPR